MIDSKALKEAVINAIVHSDYTYNTSPIVELYSDSFRDVGEIVSSTIYLQDILNGIEERE